MLPRVAKEKPKCAQDEFMRGKADISPTECDTRVAFYYPHYNGSVLAIQDQKVRTVGVGAWPTRTTQPATHRMGGADTSPRLQIACACPLKLKSVAAIIAP